MKKLAKFSLILVIVNLLFSGLYAEVVTKVWEKTYGGSKYDIVKAVVSTEDRGFIVAGNTNSFGENFSDIYLIKIDENGNKVWERTYGGKYGDEASSAITKVEDGGFIVVGWTVSFDNNISYDIYLMKIDENGNKVWEKTYGGNKDDRAFAISQAKDGGFIVVGYTESFGRGKSDIYLMKIDENGNKVWEKTYGGNKYDEASAITKAKDGGFIVAGNTNSFGENFSDIYLIKIDENGNKVWERTYGGKYGDEASAITKVKDGGFIVAGNIESFDNGFEGIYDIYLIKIDENGNKVWEKTYGRKGWDKVSAITKTIDGGFIVAGYTKSLSHGSWDVYLIKAYEK